MIDTIFYKTMHRLETAFPVGKPTKEQAKLYFEKLRNFNDDSFRFAAEHFIEHDDRGRFPVIGTILTLTEHFEEKAREREHEEIKREERAAAQELFHGKISGSELAKQSCQLIRQGMSGELTRQQYLDGMMKLGFKIQRLKKYYEFSNLPLSQNIGEWSRTKGEGINKIPLNAEVHS